MLPTILYRLSNLLLAAELLVKVNSLCNIILENKKIGKLSLMVLLIIFNN